MSNIILETERLKIEMIGEDHFDDLYKLLSNEKVHKYFPKALNEIESKEFYEKTAGDMIKGINHLIINFITK